MRRLIALAMMTARTHLRGVVRSTLGAMLILSCLLIWQGILASTSNDGERFRPSIFAHALTAVLVLWSLSAAITVSVVGSRTCMLDRRSSLLDLYITRSVSASTYAAGKLTGVVLIGVAFSAVGGLVLAVAHWVGGFELNLWFIVGCGQLVIDTWFVASVSVGLGLVLPSGLSMAIALSLFAFPLAVSGIDSSAGRLVVLLGRATPEYSLFVSGISGTAVSGKLGAAVLVLLENFIYGLAVFSLLVVIFHARLPPSGFGSIGTAVERRPTT